MSGKEKNGSERRSHGRYRVEGVTGSFFLNTDARVINLSIDGMSIETNSPLKIARNYSLSLDRGRKKMHLEGRVVWCSLIKTARNDAGEVVPVYRAGVHFEDVLTGKASDLLNFIEKNAVISLEKRVFGRFKIETGEEASVGYEAEFRVKQISQAGMLIETDMSPEIGSRFEIALQLKQVGFTAQARVVRSSPIRQEGDETAPPRVDLGIEFVDLSAESRRHLADFIKSELEA
jgi:hypothetical protein